LFDLLLEHGPGTWVINIQNGQSTVNKRFKLLHEIGNDGAGDRAYRLQCLSLVEEGAPVIVFAVHKAVVDALEAALIEKGVGFATADGSAGTKGKAEAATAFQGGQVDVIIGTTAMKEGVNLQRASHVLFVERFWTASAEEQAESRAHRRGQKNNVNAIFMQSPGTLDGRLAGIIERKRKISVEVLGEGQAVTEEEKTADELLADIMGASLAPKAKKTRAKVAAVKENPRAGVDRDAVVSFVFDPEWTTTEARFWVSRSNGFPVRGVRTVRGRAVVDVRAARRGARLQTVTLPQGVSVLIEA
jgi:superfamily II DNA/RNA helicase